MRYRLQISIFQRNKGSEQVFFLENDVADQNQERRGDANHRKRKRPRLHAVGHVHAEET